MSTTSMSFGCPGCGAALAASTSRCEHCHIRLFGELAMQLWSVDQQIASLRSRRDWLVAALRSDDTLDVLPAAPAGSTPGAETRRVLLGLGAVCLIAALTAATALIWPALGVGGQTCVLLIATAALLGSALRLQWRLPATAEAIAAVGIAASAVDLVAGRRLVAPDLSGAASHAYWSLGSLLVCAVLAYVGSRARRLHVPTVGAVLSSYGAVVAMVSPVSAADLALVGLLGALLSAAIVRGAPGLPLMRTTARATGLFGGMVFLALGLLAALAGADARGVGLWCGLALSLGVAVLPDLLDVSDLLALPGREEQIGVRPSFGAAGGGLTGVLLVRADLVPLGQWALLTAGVSAAVLMTALAAPRASRQATSALAFVSTAALVVQAVAQRSLQLDAVNARHLGDAAIGLGIIAVVCVITTALTTRVEAAAVASAGAVCAVAAAVAEAFGTRGLRASTDATAVVCCALVVLATLALALARRPREAAVATAAAVAAGALAAITVDISIALRAVSTVEAYAVAPTVVAATLAGIGMWRLPQLSSWAMAPAVFAATVPTLLLALHGDVTRQVVLLGVAAVILAVGAQCRWVCPLAMGAVEVALVVSRMLGPDIVALPRWLTLGVLGAALIVLGSTWERRVQDVRRISARVHPTVAALR